MAGAWPEIARDAKNSVSPTPCPRPSPPVSEHRSSWRPGYIARTTRHAFDSVRDAGGAPSLAEVPMTPKLACADFTFPLLDARQGARPDRSSGVRWGRHRPVRRPVAPLALPRLRRRQRVGRELASKLGDRGLEAPPTSSCRPPPTSISVAPNHPDPAIRTAGPRLVRAGRRLREQRVAVPGTSRALPGVHFEGVPEADSFGRCTRRAGLAGARRPRSRGMTFSVEAHVGSIAPTPQAARLVRRRPGPDPDASITPTSPGQASPIPRSNR